MRKHPRLLFFVAASGSLRSNLGGVTFRVALNWNGSKNYRRSQSYAFL